jgi:2-methylcitrate dehydratase PrpD
MTITRTLASWTASSDQLVKNGTLDVARYAMIDIVGCMIAGGPDEAPQRTYQAVSGLGSGAASIIGQAKGMPAPFAALVNGTAAHALDFDDNFHPTAGHATAVLAPMLLALGEERRSDGKSVLDAYIAGIEVLGAIGNGVNLDHYERGWHSTSTIGAMAGGAACARLMELGADEVQSAISFGFSMACGSKLQFGSMAKPLHVGIAAQNGIMAARFAAAGLTATPEPLDDQWGFRDLFAGSDSPGFADAVSNLGAPCALERYGLKVKIHPCCASVHTAVDGVIALMHENDLQPDDIARVDIVVNRVSFDNLSFPEPENEMEARFSMEYCVALAVTKGTLKMTDFLPEAIADPDVRAWLPRVTMNMASSEPLPIADNGREPARVHLHLADGRELTLFMQHAKGVKQNPLNKAEVWAKFEDCAGRVIDGKTADAIRHRLENFETLDNIGDLMRLLRAPSSPNIAKNL